MIWRNYVIYHDDEILEPRAVLANIYKLPKRKGPDRLRSTMRGLLLPSQLLHSITALGRYEIIQLCDRNTYVCEQLVQAANRPEVGTRDLLIASQMS